MERHTGYPGQVPWCWFIWATVERQPYCADNILGFGSLVGSMWLTLGFLGVGIHGMPCGGLWLPLSFGFMWIQVASRVWVSV